MASFKYPRPLLPKGKLTRDILFIRGLISKEVRVRNHIIRLQATHSVLHQRKIEEEAYNNISTKNPRLIYPISNAATEQK